MRDLEEVEFKKGRINEDQIQEGRKLAKCRKLRL